MRPEKRPSIWLPCLVVWLLWPVAAAADSSCAAGIAAAEAEYGIPPRLLHAIALVESGRRAPGSDPGSDTPGAAETAWPWTVNAAGRGQFLPSRAAAVAAVEALRKDGVRSIDVGCMQINLHFHPDAFASLEDAFDPVSNVDYAARLLRRLRAETGSWSRAIAHYHSANRSLNLPYRLRVLAAWRDERRRAALALREARRQARALQRLEGAAPGTEG